MPIKGSIYTAIGAGAVFGSTAPQQRKLIRSFDATIIKPENPSALSGSATPQQRKLVRNISAIGLELPIGPGVTAPQGLTASYSGGYVDILVNSSIVLTGDSLIPSKWLISSPGKSNLTIISVALFPDDKTIHLRTNEPGNGTWSVSLPTGVLGRLSGIPYTIPNPLTFSYVSGGPIVLSSRSIDARTMEVIFNKPVIEVDASQAANYTVDKGIKVTAATKVTDTVYRLTTSKQAVGVLYTVTVVNIRDLAGDPINTDT